MQDENILGDINADLEPIDLENPPAESPTETENNDTPPASTEDKKEDEPNVPFHEHPRFKELVEEKNSYKEKFESIEQQLQEIKNSPPQPASVDPQVPKEFIQLYGQEAAEHWEAYKNLNQKTLDGVVTQDQLTSAIQKEMQRRDEEKQKEAELTKKYQEEYDQKLGDVSTKHGIDKGKFRKWFVENPIVKQKQGDPNNWEYDFERGASLYAQLNPPSDRGVEAGHHGNDPVESAGRYKSLKDLKDTSWDSI